MERDQDGRGVRLSHIMKIQCFSNKSNSARRACCQNTVQEIPPRYPKGLFKSCSLHIAYLNTDSWSSESTHLGHCANPHSPLKKKKYICTHLLQTYSTAESAKENYSILEYKSQNTKWNQPTWSHALLLYVSKERKICKAQILRLLLPQITVPNFFFNYCSLLLQCGPESFKKS